MADFKLNPNIIHGNLLKKYESRGKSILYLNIKKKWFDIMITGEKKYEVRDKSKWLLSRLIDANGKIRNYDFICFRNGYKKDAPKFYAEYKGIDTVNGINWTFSNGAKLNFNDEKIIIYLGIIRKDLI
jgi:hypothetical protein